MQRARRSGLYLRDNAWWMSYTVNGRRIRESTGYRDRKSAELVLAKTRVAIKERKWFGPSKELRTPLGPAIEEFMTLYSKPRKASWDDDRIVLQRLNAHAGAGASLQDINRLVIERFLEAMRSRGLSGARINRYVATLKCFWNRQIEWGKASSNPVKGIKLHAEAMRTEYLEVGQIRALLAACSDRLRPIVQVALLTGLRKGDILRLRWDDVDLERRRISITQSKTGSQLVIHMSDALAAVFAGIRRHPDCPLVFQQDGESLSGFGWIRGDYLRSAKAAGLPGQKSLFHTLRHTVATQLRFLGKDLAVIRDQLGHKNIRMTLRYAHVAPDEMRRAAEDLGERLIGGSAVPKLVTNKSQSPIQAKPANLIEDANASKNQRVSDHEYLGAGVTQQTVNAEKSRRNEAENDFIIDHE